MTDPGVAAFLQERLRGVEPLAIASTPSVRARVVVPAYGEPLRRLIALLSSLADQDLENGALEVVVVINQPVPDGTASWTAFDAANRLLLDAPLWSNRETDGLMLAPEIRAACRSIRERLAVLAVDASSRGREIADMNIGRARNRGLAEAVLRFMREGRDGLVVMTDADAVFSDPTLLRRALGAFEQDRTLAGASGGVDIFFDPDTVETDKRFELRKRFDWYLLRRRWDALEAFIGGRVPDMPDDQSFFGSLLFMRAFDAARMGGFRDVAYRDDSYFGRDLMNYAETHHKSVLNGKRDFRVRAAIRESERTPDSLGAVVARGSLGSGFVAHPLTGREEPLSRKAVDRLVVAALSSEGGRQLVGRLEETASVLYPNAF